jgi:methylated-DNA-[protein]-cysteine S-methyltransferase
MYFFNYGPSPIGRLLLVGDGEALTRIGFATGSGSFGPEPTWREEPDRFVEAARQLDEYFAGKRREFDLPLAPKGTAFQLRVWDTLRRIPFGTTWTYLELARAIGDERAVRAVGLANGRNPLPIVIPCHRVIGSDGSLVGFGGGLDAKRFLLELEQDVAGQPSLLGLREAQAQARARAGSQ